MSVQMAIESVLEAVRVLEDEVGREQGNKEPHTILGVYGKHFYELTAPEGWRFQVSGVPPAPVFRSLRRGDRWMNVFDTSVVGGPARFDDPYSYRLILAPDEPPAPTIGSVYGKTFEKMEWPIKGRDGRKYRPLLTPANQPIFRYVEEGDYYLAAYPAHTLEDQVRYSSYSIRTGGPRLILRPIKRVVYEEDPDGDFIPLGDCMASYLYPNDKGGPRYRRVEDA